MELELRRVVGTKEEGGRRSRETIGRDFVFVGTSTVSCVSNVISVMNVA